MALLHNLLTVLLLRMDQIGFDEKKSPSASHGAATSAILRSAYLRRKWYAMPWH
jgi:hypothetical protein